MVLTWVDLESVDHGSLQRRVYRMPSREGKRWRGIVRVNGIKIRQQLFDLKKDARDWEIAQKAKLSKTGTDTDFLTLYNKYLNNVHGRMTLKTYDEKKHVGNHVKKIRDAEPHVCITKSMVTLVLINRSKG